MIDARPKAERAVSPDISVVIPTFGRPQQLLRAVRSVLAQTVQDLECIVVLDGPNPSTADALTTITDPRLKTVTLGQWSGAPAARNAGVRVSRAKWIAFLDDDDEWRESKLEQQRAAGEISRFPWPIVACQVLLTDSPAREVVPRSALRSGEPLSEYLFRRRTLFTGEGTVLTSSLLVPRELLLRVGFDEQLRRFQDVDWLLRAAQSSGVGLELVASALTIGHADSPSGRISDGGSWEQSLRWIASALSNGLVTKKAFASFVMTFCASQASRARDLRGAWVLLRETLRRGRPHLMLFAVYAALWILPIGVRRMVRSLLLARSVPSVQPAHSPATDRYPGG